MVGFYVFEGSFFQGGGGWEEIHLCNSLVQVQLAAEDYLREGHWDFSPRSETFEITAYSGGSVVGCRQLYPHTRIEVPGLTPITFTAESNPRGGAPVPGGRFGHIDVSSVWDSVELLNTLIEEGHRSVKVWIDWDAVGVPVLDGPMLPDAYEVVLDLESGDHLVFDPDRFDDVDYVTGLVTAIMKLDADTVDAGEELLAKLPELDDPDAIEDELTEVFFELNDYRHLVPGHNSTFD